MKQYAIGIFAHPDDETFGTGGSLRLLANQGAEVHIITITDGALGGSDPDITNIRRGELENAAKILSVTNCHFLDFPDGGLSNSMYHQVLERLINTVSNIVGTEESEVVFITFDQSGLTGHLDHIAASMITTCMYQKLDKQLPNIKKSELRYFCLTEEQRPRSDKNYFVYCPCGCPSDEVDIANDVTEVLDIKKQAINCHASQQNDIDNLLAAGDKLLATENFKIYKEKF